MDAVEEPLTGGNVGQVARMDDRVLRTAGPWTLTVQRLLAHLRAAGVGWCPRPLGLNHDGREILSYLDGEVPSYPMPEWVWSEANLTRMGQYLRQLHDATADYHDASATWRQPVRQPVEVVCHNDFAPYNMVFRDGRLVGVIDFDMASPGPRIWDLAYLAYRAVPLMRPGNPDGIADQRERMDRLRALIRAYGLPYSSFDVLATAVDRMRHLADFSDRLATRTGRTELHEHAAGYRADAGYLRRLLSNRAVDLRL